MKNGYLGISLGSPYYSKARLHAHAAWASLHFQQFGFLIGDFLYALTLQAMKGLPEDQALARSRRMGDALAGVIDEVTPETDLEYTILRWHDLMDHPDYARLHEAAEQDYRTCPPFKAAIRAQVTANMGERLRGTGFDADPAANTPATTLFDRYILHEVAGLTLVSEHLGFPVEIYPGPDLAIMDAIYARRFPALAKALPDTPQREFVSLTLE